MQIVKDKQTTQEWVKKSHVLDYFDGTDWDFELHEYEKGEMIASPMQPLGKFLFLVDGALELYAIREDGSRVSFNLLEPPLILGDVEYAGGAEPDNCVALPIFYTQALTRAICLALSMEKHREQLCTDGKFLHALLASLANKMSLFGKSVEMQTVEERLLFYMENVFEDHELRSVEAATMQLRCSRRQLQRVLKDLCNSGQIIRTGKGKYRLSTGCEEA